MTFEVENHTFHHENCFYAAFSLLIHLCAQTTRGNRHRVEPMFMMAEAPSRSSVSDEECVQDDVEERQRLSPPKPLPTPMAVTTDRRASTASTTNLSTLRNRNEFPPVSWFIWSPDVSASGVNVYLQCGVVPSRAFLLLNYISEFYFQICCSLSVSPSSPVYPAARNCHSLCATLPSPRALLLAYYT